MTTTQLTLPAPAALFAPGESGAGLLGGVSFDAASVLGSLRHPTAREMVASAFQTFTREQLNVIHHVVNSRGHVIVRSTAGSGKSRVLKVIAEVLPAGLRSVAVALNVSIAKELTAQLPADVHASTFHSLGAAKVRESCPVEARFVEWKRKHLIDRLLKARGIYRSQEARALLQLVRATMTHIANSPPQILALVDDLDLVFPAEWDVVDLVKAVQLDALQDFLTAGTYDYEDMLYLPLKMGYGYGSVDVALVDEAQDFSRLQHRLLRHLLGKSGRMVLVGDENQGVNGFAGADAGGMSRAAELDGAVSLQLTVTFRCPTAAVELASEFTDDIKAAPGAKDGEILRGSEDELLTWLAPGDLVMARRNAPLISLALRLASHGTPVEVLGHDLPKTLEGHVNRALAYPFTLSEIEDRLSEYGLSRLQEHYEKGVRGKALTRQLREDADLIAAIATIAGEVAWHAEQAGRRGTAAEVMATVQSLFGKGAARGAAVRLCTIHKAKGLEAARVAVLEADEVLDAGRADAQPGDRALAFVAVTRVKDTLYLAGTPAREKAIMHAQLGDVPLSREVPSRESHRLHRLNLAGQRDEVEALVSLDADFAQDETLARKRAASQSYNTRRSKPQP